MIQSKYIPRDFCHQIYEVCGSLKLFLTGEQVISFTFDLKETKAIIIY